MQSGFEKKVATFIKEQNLIVPGDRILIGLSGGADSVCLTEVLQCMAGSLSVTLGAFHVNHGIRGAEADRDEAFSRALCERYGIPFYVVREDVPVRAKEWQTGLEEAGRRVRYEAAERIANEQGYDKIALAHHQNDVAETMLFHLFRGSSVGGLASIPPKRGQIIRPLLSCDREEIEGYLALRGCSYCVDGSNEDTEYTRNKIRHRIVAYAQTEINTGAVGHMAETAAELGEVEEYLTGETEAVCRMAEQLPEGIGIPVSLLAERHGVIQRRVIYRFIGTVAGSKKDITKEHVEAVRGLLNGQSGKRVSLPYGVVAAREFDRIVIKKENGQAKEDTEKGYKISVPGEYPMGANGESLCFRVFSYEKNAEIPKNEYTKWFDYDKIMGVLCLRTYCDGDRIGLRNGSKTVKSVWLEHKIPAEQRKQRLLLADDVQVLWIPGIRSCDNYRIDENTKTVLEVQRNGGK